MAGPRNKAHVRARRSRLNHTLLILVALVSLATSTVMVYSQTSVQAPLLAKTVVLDGRVTSPDEWSDTTGTPLAMFLREGTEKKDGVLWAKHDGEWLYLLFRVERLSSDNPKDGCGVYYHWGPGAVGTKAKLSDSAEVSKRGITQDSYGYDGTRWYDDVGDGGTNDVQGTATQDSTYLWCELRKMLDSGDTKHDWILSVGKTYGATDEQMFAGVLDANAEKAYNAALTLSLLQTPMPPASTATTAIGGPGTTSIAQTQTTVRQTPVALPAIVGVVAVVAVASFLMLKRRKPTAAITVQDRKAPEALPPEALPPSGPTVSTGYADLDRTLAGGLPEGYAILLVSPSCDERDLLLRKIIESGVSSGKPTPSSTSSTGSSRFTKSHFKRDLGASWSSRKCMGAGILRRNS
jgi:hypothetical protein